MKLEEIETGTKVRYTDPDKYPNGIIVKASNHFDNHTPKKTLRREFHATRNSVMVTQADINSGKLELL